MNNKPSSIKIPEGCYSKCIENKLLNQVVFYYTLKRICSNGYFANGTLIATVSKVTGQSDATIWRKVKQLISVGLIKKHKQGYRLVSYDTLFTTLGYDLTLNKGRKGSFKIHKLPSSQVTDIKSWLAFVDVRDNLNSQIHRAFYNLSKDKRHQYAEKNLHYANRSHKREILNDIAKDHVRMIELNDQAQEMREYDEAYGKKTKSNIYCNADVTLSLKGVCKILGLSNTSSAHLIIKRIQSFGLITVKKRCVRIGTTIMDYSTYLRDYSDLYILRDGQLWRRLPNKIQVGV